MDHGNGWKYSEDQYISTLGFSKLKKLSEILDTRNQTSSWAWWKELAGKVPGVKYSSREIERMGTCSSDGNAAYAFLVDLSNRSIRLGQLITGLKAIEMNEALRELEYREDAKVTEQPQSAVTVEGGTVTLKCKATGFPPPSYQWFKDRTELVGETSCQYTVENIQLNQSGKYICRAMNIYTVDFSKWVEIKVTQPFNIPRVMQPKHTQNRTSLQVIEQLPPELELPLGSELRLSIQVHGPGSERLFYKWYRNGNLLATTREPVFQIKQVVLEDHGIYICTAYNETDSILSTECVVNVITGHSHYYHEHNINEMNSIVSAEHNGTNIIYDGFNPPTSSYQLPPDGTVDSYMILGNRMPMHNGVQPQPVQPQPVQPQPRIHKPLNKKLDVLGAAGTYTPEQVSSPELHYRHHSNHEYDDGGDRPSGQPSSSSLESDPIPINLSVPCADKIALLIGNREYREKEMPKLRTPEMDTHDLAGALFSIGFKVVSLVNLTKAEMDQALTFFLSLLGANVYALFFFAGHGFQSVDGQNYLMGVDTTLEKDPRYCLCAQDIKTRMQHTGAKVSIMLLDMCRVAASTQPGCSFFPTKSAPLGIYHYNNYFVVGFACSTNGYAFEAQEDSKRNSYFVTEIIRSLNESNPHQKEKIDIFLNKVCEGVCVNRPSQLNSTEPWQKPETQSNLGEHLSLFDEIHLVEFPEERERKAQGWKYAHMIPDPLILHAEDCQVVLRLQFAAEHSNVLIIMVEQMSGCSSTTNIHHIHVDLQSVCAAQAEPVTSVPSCQYQDKEMSYRFAKEQGKNNLTHFRITELQKLRHPVVIKVTVSYSYEVAHQVCRKDQVISHELTEAPLYARTVNEMRQYDM